jgi:7,8-dihydro-6-hydroxymethylpterin-pyrophosphokinase
LNFKIEKRLGRVPNLSTEYQSRVIDIDIVAFDDDVIY